MASRQVSNRAKGLSPDLITRTALELIDNEGVGAATMRAIAGRLGVEAMSLYKHVSTRDELLDLVVELIVAELDQDPEVRRDATEGWRDYLTRLARGVRRYALAHPHAFPLVTTRPAEAPWINPPLRSLAWIESMLATLQGEGFSPAESTAAARKRPAKVNFKAFTVLLLESCSLRRVSGARLVYGDCWRTIVTRFRQRVCGCSRSRRPGPGTARRRTGSRSRAAGSASGSGT